MGMKKSGRRCRARARHHSDISTFGGGVRISRASLLAGASLVALVAFAAPDRAFAACSGLNRTISTPTTGPVYSNGGAITVTKSGSITGLDGVDVTVCPTTTLTNSGMISGGSAGANTDAAGGAGVSNSATTTITKLTNSGMIGGGGAGGNADAAGGAGVSNSGTITTLTNGGMISGGSAGADGGAAGGAGCPTPARSRR